MQQSPKDPPIKLFGQQIPLTEPDTDKDALKRNEMEALQQDDDDEEDSDSQQHKTLKKPDQILACPRCRSMDTKFCYYNNYNVKQPRHLCKACRRYWTAGGAMRNVPIGAGPRKNMTSSASPRRHITSTMLNFKLDRPICNPIDSNSREEQRGGDIISSLMQNNGTSAPWNYPWVAPSSLGKHSREGGDIDEPKQKSCVLVPKALRIDDPKEAAKSSIWKTLGIRAAPLSGGGMSKAFQPKGDEKKETNHLVETSPALMANPAALSRSLNFHERS